METQYINDQLVPVSFSETHAELLLKRLDQLFPYTPTQAGTKNATQMLADCADNLELVFGKPTYPRPFSQLSMGRFFKSDQCLSASAPRNFYQEKQRLIQLIRHLVKGGPDRIISLPFLGQQGSIEWGAFVYQYLDAHLTQFGV